MSVREYYRKKDYVSTYDSVRFGNAGGRFVTAWEKAILHELVKSHPIDEPIVEIAAGTGRFSLMLAEMGYSVIAVDGSLEMLKTIRAAAERDGLNVRCVQADAFKLPFADDAFKTVFSMRFVWHFRNYRDVLAEIVRVSGGDAVFDVMNRYSLAAVTTPIANHIVYRDLYTDLVSRREIRAFLSEIDASPVAERSAFFFPFVLYRKLPLLAGIMKWLDTKVLRGLGLDTMLYFKVTKHNGSADR